MPKKGCILVRQVVYPCKVPLERPVASASIIGIERHIVDGYGDIRLYRLAYDAPVSVVLYGYLSPIFAIYLPPIIFSIFVNNFFYLCLSPFFVAFTARRTNGSSAEQTTRFQSPSLTADWV